MTSPMPSAENLASGKYLILFLPEFSFMGHLEGHSSGKLASDARDRCSPGKQAVHTNILGF